MDVRAPLRVALELLWTLRRGGFSIPTSQAIDVARALDAVGFESKELVRDAVAAIVVQRHSERARFDALFDAFFSLQASQRGRAARGTLWDRLEARGLSQSERDAVKELLDAFAASSGDAGALVTLVHRGADLDRLLWLAGASRLLEGMQSPLQSGFYVHRLLEHVKVWRAHDALAALRARLVDALGDARASAVAAALEAELALAAEDVRRFVDDTLALRDSDADRPKDLASRPFTSLDPVEIDEVRRAVRRFVQRLRGGERVRRRRARKGRVDPHATLRRAMRSSGVPFWIARKERRRDKPKLVVLCDVSESVRTASRFLLELAFVSQELFAGTRTFVFVSELGETTRLFERERVDVALSRAYSGAVVPVTHNSNYGRILRAFREHVLADVDRRTTVVILGDGRTNYADPEAEILDAIRARARALVWLCPEPRAAWATGDSAMPRYAPKCTAVLEARSARDLEEAARLLLTLR